jgi:hypothetical protein
MSTFLCRCSHQMRFKEGDADSELWVFHFQHIIDVWDKIDQGASPTRSYSMMEQRAGDAMQCSQCGRLYIAYEQSDEGMWIYSCYVPEIVGPPGPIPAFPIPPDADTSAVSSTADTPSSTGNTSDLVNF